MKNRYKIFIGLMGVLLILNFIPSNLYSAGKELEPKTFNSELFYGTWKVAELLWYSEDYFASDSVRKEMQQEIGKPVDNFVITIEPANYIESSSEHNYKVDKPQYFFETYDVNSNLEVIYNSISSCEAYLETLNITDKPIEYLIVRDPIKDKMDSGEIDWHYVPTPIFIIVDEDTLFLTSEKCVEVYKCERVVN